MLCVETLIAKGKKSMLINAVNYWENEEMMELAHETNVVLDCQHICKYLTLPKST